MFDQSEEHEGNESEILELIKKLMEELTGKMEYSSDDFEKRLGRKKPEVEVSVVKGAMPPPAFGPMDKEGDMAGDMDDDDDMEGDESPSMDEGDSLKDRLMRLRKG